MRIRYIFSSNPRNARIMVRITGIILGLLLVVSLILWGLIFHRSQTWSPVSAEVSAFSTADSADVWTEFTFTYEGSIYNVRQRGHSYWMYPGLELLIYCNPQNPQQFQIADTMYALPRTAAMASGIWAVLTVLMLLNYLRVRNR